MRLEICFLHQTFVLMGHHVCLQLGQEVHHNHHNNQQGCTAEIERDVPNQNQELWQQANQRDVNSTHRSQARHYTVNILCSLLAWTDTWDKSARFFQVIGCLT